jgi:hypothetical protein
VQRIEPFAVAKSKYDPGPAPKSEMRTYEATPGGSVHLTIHIETADGKLVMQTTTYRRDGKPHGLTNNPDVDSIETLPASGGGRGGNGRRKQCHEVLERCQPPAGDSPPVFRHVSDIGWKLGWSSFLLEKYWRGSHIVLVVPMSQSIFVWRQYCAWMT